MRILLVLAMVGVLSVGVASAQDVHTPYAGIGVTLIPAFDSVLPLVSIQAGTPVADFLELRATFDTLINFNVLGGDVLFTFKPGAGFKPYLGVGGIVYFPGTIGFDAEVVLGAEYAPSNIGFFGEVNASVIAIAYGYFGPYFRAGVNFHF